MRSRPWQTLGLKPFQMKRNRFDHFPLHFVPCRPRGDAPRKIRRVGRKSCFRFFDNHEVSHRRPACFSTLLRVPGASSSPGFPGTVTSPGFQGCLNWRCEPRCRTSNQPSASSSLITSRTLRGKASAELSASHGSQFPRTPAIVRRCDVASIQCLPRTRGRIGVGSARRPQAEHVCGVGTRSRAVGIVCRGRMKKALTRRYVGTLAARGNCPAAADPAGCSGRRSTTEGIRPC